MEELLNKVWGVALTMFSGLVGFFMYHQKKTNDRLSKVENDLAQSKCDIAVVQESVRNIKDDTQEIKESQKAIIDLLTTKRK